MFGFFKKKDAESVETEKKIRHDFDDIDRQHAIAMRTLNREIRRMQLEMERIRMKGELADLKEEYFGTDESDASNSLEDTLLTNLMMPLLNKNQNSGDNLQIHPTNEVNPPPSDLTDEQIRGMLKQIDKKYLKIGRTMPKEMVKRVVLQKMPLTNEEFDRAYNIYMTEM